MGARVIGIGTALPEKVLTNDDLAAMMDTSDEWIRERTGIKERRIGLPTSTLSIQAGQAALDAAGLTADEVDLFILATTTPDQRTPGTSATVQSELGLSCGAFDINAACAGFTYSFITANALLEMPGGPKRLLLIGADALSPVTDWTDRSTAILFGDAGGAVVLERTDNPTLLGWNLGTDGKHRSILYCDHGSKVKMEGREVFKVAVRAVSESVLKALDQAGIEPHEVDVLLPHQANIRIIEAICKRTGIDFAKSHNVIDRTGNTCAATIPMTMNEAHLAGALQPGAIVAMTGFGAGMTWATAIVRW